MHWSAAADVTAPPDDAVACTVKSACPYVAFGSAPNEIVWSAFAIANVWLTSGAAL